MISFANRVIETFSRKNFVGDSLDNVECCREDCIVHDLLTFTSPDKSSFSNESSTEESPRTNDFTDS